MAPENPLLYRWNWFTIKQPSKLFTKERGFNNIRFLTCLFVRHLRPRIKYGTGFEAEQNPASNFRVLFNPRC